MKKRAAWVAVLLALLWASPSTAFFLDEERTLQVTGKTMVQTSWRLEDSDSNGRTCLLTGGSKCENFTFPTTKTGHMIQQRNMLDVEFFHNVAGWLGHEFTLLDRLSYRCITIGFPLLTIGILTGSIWLKTTKGGYLDWQDGRQTASLLIWFLYAGLLHGRLIAGWRGRRIAWMNVIGFLVILITFLQLSHFQK